MKEYYEDKLILKINIYIDIDIKEKNIMMENLNIKVNIYLIENGMEKNMMKKEILLM